MSGNQSAVLVKHGADIEAKADNGRTSPFEASTYPPNFGVTACLLEASANPNPTWEGALLWNG
ncbi:hypothetical protein BCR34DRAFT_559916 [Clohesyomyces aquaticus]|uniref:Ankyrin repeat-containing domain protein n=1 Tax=Clohesyomyces aquaticus TaxID=1231657 RepID=A0A1Y1ZX51_9PLEO|nr:hypothetical protein BCR34DRAFT_559916 [Clohesyomyces aquaticus]